MTGCSEMPAREARLWPEGRPDERWCGAAGLGQALVCWLPVLIPVFVLFDFSVPMRDPLMRRYGDRWAGTRVIDTESWLSQVRRRIQERLYRKKGIRLLNPIQTPMSTFARTVE